MADVKSLSPGHVIYLATELCSKADYEGTQALQSLRPDVLSAELCFRVLLTFASGNENPDQYLPLLKQLQSGTDKDAPPRSVDISDVENISEANVRRRIRDLRLERLKTLQSDVPGAQNALSQFLIQQAYRIDAETGDLPAILRLIEPFINGNDFLRAWLISNLLPLLRLDYGYYSDGGSSLSLEAFENLEGIAGLDVLLQRAKTDDGKTHIGRDLRGIVGPWVYGSRSYKRRKLSHSFRRASISAQNRGPPTEDSRWQDVNEWILRNSLEKSDLAVKAVSGWGGPKDVDLGGYDETEDSLTEDVALTMKYGQAALAAVYASDEASSESLQRSSRILDRVTEIVQADPSTFINFDRGLPDCSAQPQDILSMTRADLFTENLLRPDHALTWPKIGSLRFLKAILTSIRLLREDLYCSDQLSCRSATNLCLFATEQIQRQELHRALQHLARIASPEGNWHQIRKKVLWLSFWESEPSARCLKGGEDCRAFFWRVSSADVETEVFTAMLAAKQYTPAIDTYLGDPNSSPLPLSLVEKLVEQEILDAYDNASNGNRSRGGMKRASEILKAFGSFFPLTSPVNKIEHLLAATHSLSFYHLTLQHGVPFKPVSIRVHQDPISLISKVLEQNSKAYTQLDDLIAIGRGLVAAGLPNSEKEQNEEPLTPTSEDPMGSKMLQSDHRITYDAIIAALSSNDFDTAYSYILTRLSPSSTPSDSSSGPVDDTSWRAAYAAGRHRPSSSSAADSSPSHQIALLSKRMDLLSLALTLVPSPDPLPDMLTTWQKCDHELSALRAREAAEEKAWDDRGDTLTSVPGGFGLEDRDIDAAETRREREKRGAARKARGGPAGGTRFDEDEAPMGLFDVARGAARAIGTSAFPLRGAGGAQAVKVGDREGPQSRGSGEYARSITGAGGSGGSGDEGQQRVRKRDMVSKMVTGGLVSGLGWVLGAEPVKRPGLQQEGGGGDQ
jgi:protein transport protein SEC39